MIEKSTKPPQKKKLGEDKERERKEKGRKRDTESR